MAAKSDSSMSALGQFYDAILAVSEDQGKKYGQGAAPDFIAGNISDGIAGSIAQIGAALATNPVQNAAQSVTDSLSNYASGKLTPGKINVNQLMPFNLGQLFPTFSYDLGTPMPDSAEDKSINASTGTMGFKAEPKLEYGNPNDIILDTKAVADKAAAAYWESIKRVRKAAFWGGVRDSVQEAANYWEMRKDDVPNDIAATIVNAKVKVAGKQTSEVNAQNPSDVFATDVKESPVIDYEKIAQRSSHVAGNSFAMYSGIVDQDQREEFVNYTQRELFEDIKKEYNKRAAASTLMINDSKGNPHKAYNQADNFFEVFSQVDPSSGGLFLTKKSQKDLFAGPDTHGDMLQESFQKAIEKAKSNPLLPASLRSNMQKFEDKVLNDTEFAGLLSVVGKTMEAPVPKIAMSKSKAVLGGQTIPSDLTPLVQLGAKNLSGTLRAQGSTRLATSLDNGVLRATTPNGNLTTVEKMAYMAERWSTQAPLNQWLTAPMIIMGDADGYAKLVNGMGGITGVGPLTGASRAGIDVFGAFGSKNAAQFQLTTDGGASANPILKWAYGSGGDFSGAANQFGKPAFLVSAEANGAQKLAHFVYVHHPVNMVKGYLNGSFFANRIHINSNYGKLYKDPAMAKMFRSEDLGNLFTDPSTRAFMSGKSFGSLFVNPTNKDSKKGIAALRDYLNQRWNSIGNKNSEEAKNVLRARAVLKNLERVRNPKYRALVNSWETVNKVIGLPGQLQKKAIDWGKKAAWKLAVKVAAKVGLKAALEATAAFFSAGVSLVFTRTYAVLNFLSFGFLDKIVFGTIKLTYELIVAIVVAVIATFLLLSSIIVLPAISSLQYVQMGAFEGGGLWAPDPNYVPVLAESAEAPPDGIGEEDPLVDLAGADGIDVSHHQGNIKWDLVKTSKIEFAIIKATEGSNYNDPMFRKNWNESKKNGIVRSAYHYFCPTIDGKAQAENYIKAIKGAGGTPDFVISVDVELSTNVHCQDPSRFTKELSTKNLKAMLDRLEAEFNKKPMIYTSAVMWNAMTTQPGWAGDGYPLWVAAYNNSGPGTLPKGWSDWTVWQYSSNGKINGISGNVDLDKWNKNGGESGGYENGGGGVIGPLPPIDWSKYDTLSSNSCPVQRPGGVPVLRCTQGPNGPTSHGGKICPSGQRCNYAVDIGPGPGSAQVVAPEAGKVSSFSMGCNGGRVSGIKLTASNGKEYRFLHVVPNPSVQLGSTVAQGTIIAAMIEGPSLCSNGSHVHFEYWVNGVMNDRPDAAYAASCGQEGTPLKCDE